MWGVCYQLDDSTEEAAQHLAKLDIRERRFDKIILSFYPVCDITNEGGNGYSASFIDDMAHPMVEANSIPSLAYIARPNGPLFLGDAPIDVIALEASKAAGPSGPNSEYIFKLADFMRKYVPQVDDMHLFAIERELLHIVTAAESSV